MQAFPPSSLITCSMVAQCNLLKQDGEDEETAVWYLYWITFSSVIGFCKSSVLVATMYRNWETLPIAIPRDRDCYTVAIWSTITCQSTVENDTIPSSQTGMANRSTTRETVCILMHPTQTSLLTYPEPGSHQSCGSDRGGSGSVFNLWCWGR